MKRKTMINLHLYLSSVSLFLLLLFICSGSLHLLNIEEGESKESLGQYQTTDNLDKAGLEELFKSQLTTLKPSYRFDYMKGRDTSLMTRPTTRTYYTIDYNPSENSAEIVEHVPNFNKRLMEFHKGHGPKASRKILAFIGLIFALTIFTGLWLGLTVKVYRKITLLSSATSLLIVLLLFNL